MTRKSIKSALNASLKAEDEAVKSRFEKAESLLGERTQPDDSPSDSPLPSTPTVPDVKEQPKKERVIRDSFTLPSGDYDLIAAIRQRCLGSAVNVTKSEVVRAGLHALMEMPEEDLLRLIGNLEKVKTGRPINKM
jgi:hypothetical protein